MRSLPMFDDESFDQNDRCGWYPAISVPRPGSPSAARDMLGADGRYERETTAVQARA